MLSAAATGVFPSPVALREATPSDLEFIRGLCRRLFLAYGSYHRYVEEWFHHENVSTLVAEIEGVPAGVAMVALGPGACDLVAIGVTPELQSRGAGKALLEGVVALARESSLGVKEIHLQVAEGNARAQRMFAKHGFRVRSETGIYPAGQRALFMVKALG
jgi:ribosomal protein S18 acetylase RimI-like enzyme